MSEYRDRDRVPADDALTNGLRGLPVPGVGDGFDARVLATLRPAARWGVGRLWQAVTRRGGSSGGKGPRWAGGGMSAPARLNLLLGAAAIGALLAVCIAPESGWIARRQLRAAAGGVGAGAQMVASGKDPEFKLFDDATLTAARRSGDPALRIAAVMAAGQQMQPRDGTPWAEVLSLAKGIPNEPMIQATALRLMCQGEIKINRPLEEQFLSAVPDTTKTPPPVTGTVPGGPLPLGGPQPTVTLLHTPKPEPVPVSPLVLKIFMDAAADGARIEPRNAYFPTMAAIGHFAAKRDEEAVRALRRAASLPEWREYVPEVALAQVRLLEMRFGRATSLERTAVYSAVMFPHYALVRGLARVAVARAVRLELAGKRDEGMAIRRDLVRLGGLMREQSTSVIGSLVGIAVSQIPGARPGGKPVEKVDTSLSNEQRLAAKREEYALYLIRHGYATELAEYRAECQAGDAARAAVNGAWEEGPLGLDSLVWGAVAWGAALLLMGAALWLAGGGLAGAVYLRKRAEREQLGLRPDGWRLSAAVVVAAAVALTAATWPLVRAVADFQSAYMTVVSWGSTEDAETAVEMAPVFSVALLAAPLAVVAFVSMVVALFRRVPVRAGVAQGLRLAGPPLALILLIAYSGLVVMSAQKEKLISAEWGKSLRHEGRYLAALRGTEWPGSTEALLPLPGSGSRSSATEGAGAPAGEVHP
jgi:hypothetical protein